MTEKVNGAQRLSAVSPQAMRLGLSPGLTLADARARAPQIIVRERDSEADARLLQWLADDCERFSPVVAIDSPDGLLLDITGCAHLSGDEAGLRKSVCERFRRFGFHVRATVAGTPDAARALARFARIVVSREGEDEIHARRLPIAALELPEETRVALLRAGLKTIDDLASRPSLPLSTRFGEDLSRRLRRMFGPETRPVTPRRITPVCRAQQRFAEPVARIEDIEATLEQLIGEAAHVLAQRRQGGRCFEASFFRSDGAVRRIAVETGRPTRDPKSVMRLYRERLDTLADPIDPGFGFDMIRISVLVAEPLGSAQTSLDGGFVEEGEVTDLVDRLTTRFGRERVLRFARNDTHDPDRAACLVPAAGADCAAWPSPETGEPPLRPIQLFEPPQEIITTSEVPDGPPRTFKWRRMSHRIVRAEGPERVAPEWWRNPDAPTRDYFRVEDEGGRRFWVFRAGLYDRETPSPRWYLHGLFA